MAMHPVSNDWKLYLPGLQDNDLNGKLVVAGDVGGTKTNLALFRVNDGLEEVRLQTYASGDYASLQDLIGDFFAADNQEIPARICLGVAGPVINENAQLTNLGWNVRISDLSEKTGVSKIKLLNDLEATAYGLAALSADDIETLKPGHDMKGNCAIVAPGTGLGEAGLFWDGSALRPFPTEGGHCDFSPRTPLDYRLYQYLEKRYGVVSWEKLISGPAIEDIFNFLVEEKKYKVPVDISNQFNSADNSAVISTAAMEGSDPVCVEAMNLFVGYLARECTSMALKMKSVGGLLLSGGIPPKILPLLKQPLFREQFMDSDRMDALLEQVGIHVILNQQAPMLGAACYAAYGLW